MSNLTNLTLNEIIKPINSQTNNKSLGNYILTAELYVHCSSELAPVVLDVYDSWRKLGTMFVTSGAGIISVIYKKIDKKDIVNYRNISFLNLHYEIYIKILKNRMQRTLDTIIGKNQLLSKIR